MNREQLLIPMAMKAMIVGESQGSFIDMSHNYQSLSFKPLGNDIEPDYSSIYSNEDKGVHIHWILPDAMKQGIQDDKSDDVIYPSVPNRWHVTRLWAKDNDLDGEVNSISWTIESDVLQKQISENNGNLRSPQVPTLSDRNKQYRFLGRSYLYNKSPKVCDEVLEKLTAVGPALPTFSAYYPSCRNVFGFYDNMLDLQGNELENVTATYVVCGWYSDSNQDFLNGVLSREDCKEKFSWNVPENLSFPASSLCHSTISGIKWKNKKEKYESYILKNNIEIAIGNNTAEALAALKEHEDTSGYHMERMLNLFYSSGETILKDKNGLLKGENKVHQDRFGSEKPITQMAIKENDKYENSTPRLYETTNLREINSKYVEIFHKNIELESFQQRVYDCWYKYVLLGQQRKSFDYDQEQEAIKYQKQYIEEIESLKSKIETKWNEIKALEDKLEEEKTRLEQNLPDHLLVSQNGQNFWTPNEPVVLLKGIQRDNTYSEYERSSEDGTLLCRSVSQIITSLTIDNLEGAFDIPTTVDSQSLVCKGDIPTIIEPLVKETFIISTDFALRLAAKILDLRKCRSDKNLKALTEKIKKLHNTQTNNKLILSLGRECLNQASGFNGVYPEKRAVGQWEKPWSPLFLIWKINYYPDRNLLQDVPTLKDWQMDENLLDYQFKGEILVNNPVEIEGQSILVPNGATVTAGSTMHNLGNETLAKEALNMDVLSQNFSGFNSKFIMRKNDVILPVNLVNSKGIDLGDYKLDFEQIHSLLKGYELKTPDNGKFFSPIRGGFMALSKVGVIDSFGQFREISCHNVAVAENMRNNKSVAQAEIMLTPRLIQPSRLNFRWLNPNTDVPQDENGEESPICGWLLPNYVNKAIMVYDNKGNLLGSLQSVKLDNFVVWKDNPENGGGTVPPPKDMNSTLYKIILSIIELSRKKQLDLLTLMLDIIDLDIWSINPDSAQQYSSLAQYIGRPLIVVNSCVKLEQRGIPKQFKQLEIKKDTKGPNNIDVTKTKFEVQVGRVANHGDGVIGFFKDNNYDTMYITTDKKMDDEKQDEANYFNTENTVTLSIGDEYPTKLTIIMDFAASIDLISGFLPTKTVKPNDHSISEALDKIYFTIFSSPVLGDIDQFAIPCPKLDGRQWSWLHYRDSEFKDEEIFRATDQGYFPKGGVCAQDGWLKLKINKTNGEKE